MAQVKPHYSTLYSDISSQHSGVVLLGRRPRQHYSRRAIGKLIGLVSQDEYIPFNFTVLEYVLLGRAPAHAASANTTVKRY